MALTQYYCSTLNCANAVPISVIHTDLLLVVDLKKNTTKARTGMIFIQNTVQVEVIRQNPRTDKVHYVMFRKPTTCSSILAGTRCLYL